MIVCTAGQNDGYTNLYKKVIYVAWAKSMDQRLIIWLLIGKVCQHFDMPLFQPISSYIEMWNIVNYAVGW